MGKTILILGGGTGGVVAANVLGKTLPKKHDIVLVDKNDHHHFYASYPLVMTGRRRPGQVRRPLKLLEHKGVDFIRARVMQIDTESRRVHTSEGSLGYDYLMIALGAEHHPETVPGLAGAAYNPYDFGDVSRLRRKLAAFRRGSIVVFISSLPYTGVIAPWEIMFLLDSYFRRREMREQVGLTLVTPESAPLPLAGPKVGESVRRAMNRRGISLITQAKILSLDQANRKLILDHGIEIPGDLFLGIPSHWGPSALRGSDLTGMGGWVQIDPHTLETGTEGVFAVGDATASILPVSGEWAPKAGFFAHYQAEVAARNIALTATGRKPRFRFTGKAAGAVMLTGHDSGRAAYVNYHALPRPRVILLRPTRAAYLAKVAFEKYWLARWF